ncbi:hypothetical protein [Antarctobacter jejuensis]|uniref:hypothetical protein n=1 Tax=Antarctobacter jejuensis TaxID=1439938 RepID=UPI003FD4A2DE
MIAVRRTFIIARFLPVPRFLTAGLICLLAALTLVLSLPEFALNGQRLMLPPPNINALRWILPAPATPEDLHGF